MSAGDLLFMELVTAAVASGATIVALCVMVWLAHVVARRRRRKSEVDGR